MSAARTSHQPAVHAAHVLGHLHGASRFRTALEHVADHCLMLSLALSKFPAALPLLDRADEDVLGASATWVSAWTACHYQPGMLCDLILWLRLGGHVQPGALPQHLHGLVPALVASLARRPGLPPGMLASVVLQFEPILSSIAEHQRQQGIPNRAAPDAITSDYDAEYMVGGASNDLTKPLHAPG